MQVCRVTSTRAGHAFGKHFDDLFKVRARKMAIWISSAHGLEQIIFPPVFGGAHGHDLLRQNVQRRFGNGDAVEIPLTNGAHQRSAFQQVVAGSREDAAFGHGAAPVTRAADTLQAHRNGPRRANLANQINAADVDTQFERSRRYERADFSSLQLSFGDQSQLARQAAVMRGNGVFSEAFGKMMRHAFCQATGIDKNKRGAVFGREGGNAIVDFVPHFVARHGTKLAAGNFDREIELAPRVNLHDHWIRPVGAGQKMAHQLNRLLRSGKTNAREALSGQLVQAF